jgi:branched-chain amino acid transport system substrate-binding protein
VLGTYSIDKNGDTTLTDRSLESVEDGQLTFVKIVKGKAP